jgi:hypothetical protein
LKQRISGFESRNAPIDQGKSVVLSPLNDLGFCATFDISFNKRTRMRKYLRRIEPRLNVFSSDNDFKATKRKICSVANWQITDVDGKKVMTCNNIEDVLFSRIKDLQHKLVQLNDFEPVVDLCFVGDTGHKFTKFMVGIANIPNGCSPLNFTLIGLYEGKDNRNELRANFAPIAQQINALQTIEINGTTYRLRKYLTGDMPFLCACYGHQGHSSRMPCLFCLSPQVDKNNRSVWSSTIYLARTLENVKEDALKSRNNIVQSPLFDIEVDFVVPSPLHILLGLVSDILTTIRIKLGEEKTAELDAILRRVRIVSQNYWQALNGNMCKKLIGNLDLLGELESTFNEQNISGCVQQLRALGRLQTYMSTSYLSRAEETMLETEIRSVEVAWHEPSAKYTPKAQWLFRHVVPFIKKHHFWNMINEQAVEHYHVLFRKDKLRLRGVFDSENLFENTANSQLVRNKEFDMRKCNAVEEVNEEDVDLSDNDEMTDDEEDSDVETHNEDIDD